MKMPEKGDLVGEDAGPRPARFVKHIRDGGHLDEVLVGTRPRGGGLTEWRSLHDFLKTYEWRDDHILGGGWVRRPA